MEGNCFYMSSNPAQTLKNPPAGVKPTSRGKATIQKVMVRNTTGRLAVVVLSVCGLLSGGFALLLGCGTGLGVGLGLYDTLARSPGVRKLGTEEND
jgi:hypothetical protein